MKIAVKRAAIGFAVGLGCMPAATAAAVPADHQPGPITALQQRLAALGYAPGPIDGVMSAQTEQAMRRYRRATGQPIAPGPAGDPIVAAQTALQRLGFLAAPADGVIGPQTRDAIIRFEAAQGAPVDPRVSDQLLAALARVAAAPVAGPGAPPSAAVPPPAEPSPAEPAFTGRQPLPPGVNPPPIR
ncbi:MAG TPA: peptidoglycan-binding domain-containing protein [Stellaceae bacterium]|nr:peptidoglycan-binding domain-containing protein [Stellaceae bacterium]